MTPELDAAQQAVGELVAHYRGKARAVARAGLVLGATVGVLVGSVPLTPLKFVWSIPSSYGAATVLGGLGAGLLIGYVVGGTRARMYHRMAAQARLQLELEARLSQSDARMSQLLGALAARAAAARAKTPAAEPQPVSPSQLGAPLSMAPSLAPAQHSPAALRHLTQVPPAYTRIGMPQEQPPLSPPVSGSGS